MATIYDDFYEDNDFDERLQEEPMVRTSKDIRLSHVAVLLRKFAIWKTEQWRV